MQDRKRRASSRILVLNPVRPGPLDQISEEFFRAKASPGFHIECESLADAPTSVEFPSDEAVAAAAVVRRVLQVAHLGFGGIVINCFLDPGLQATRDLTRIPVVGAGESAVRIALSAGERFSIIDVGPIKYAHRSPTRQVRSMGVTARFASIRGIGVPVLELNRRPDLTIKKIAREAKLAATQDRADVVVLGCTALAGLAERIKLNLPIVNPALSALRAAEMLSLLGLRRGARSS